MQFSQQRLTPLGIMEQGPTLKPSGRYNMGCVRGVSKVRHLILEPLRDAASRSTVRPLQKFPHAETHYTQRIIFRITLIQTDFWIVISLFPIDLAQQSEFRLVLNLSEKFNYNPNLVWINKFRKRFLRVLQELGLYLLYIYIYVTQMYIYVYTPHCSTVKISSFGVA